MAGYTPVLVRRDGVVALTTFERLARLATTHGGDDGTWTPTSDGHKQACELPGVEVWSDSGWTRAERIIRHAAGKPMVRVLTHTGVLDVTTDHSLLRPDGTPLRPADAAIGDELLHTDPPGGPFVTDAWAAGSQLAAARDFLESFVPEQDQSDKNDVIVDLIDLGVPPTGTFVYDLTTASGHFSAGVGRLVAHNTDSVFVRLPSSVTDMGEAFRIGESLATSISATFKKPIELEFEKVYLPLLLFGKKRYVGTMFTTPDKPDYVDAKGIQLVRRDNCPLVKKASQGILDELMYRRDPEAAVRAARAVVAGVLRGEYPIDDFVVSKALRSEYKNAAQPHLVVAKKIAARRGYPVPSGERVKFVFVEGEAKLLADKAEDPEYVTERGLPLDVVHYVTNQLQSPIEALLELLVPDPHAAVFGDPEIQALMTGVRRERQLRANKRAKQHSIVDFFARK